jgi:hypothetical protein
MRSEARPGAGFRAGSRSADELGPLMSAIGATSAGITLAGISSDEICVAFAVVPAMVVADSPVALDSAPLQVPAEGTMVMTGGAACELPQPGAW